MRLRTLPMLGVTAVLAGTGTLGGAGPASVSVAGTAYVTIQFGRSIEGSYTSPGCVPVPGILRLDQAVTDLHSLGMMAVGTVSIDRASTTTEDCTGGDFYANWADLHSLNTTDGFQVISEGLNHNDTGA
jgi:hypothetical protein